MIERLPLKWLRLRVPNTRVGAAMVAGAIAALGFLIGVGLLVVTPLLRANQSVRPPVDVRSLAQYKLPAPAAPIRPELWQTPVGSFGYPADAAVERLRSAGAKSGVFQPGRGPNVIAFSPVQDVSSGSTVLPVAALGVADERATPGPARPSAQEPTQLTIAASGAGAEQLSGCVLVIDKEGLRPVGSLGPTTLDECAGGQIRLISGSSLSFAVEYQKLPNVQSRDGVWHEGSVFGRTQVLVIAGVDG